MEHILQFGINIDDDAIIKKAEEMAAKAFLKGVEDKYLTNSWSGNLYNNKMEDLITASINGFLEENKEQILTNVSKILADKLSRTKAAKEVLAIVIEENK